MFSERPSFGGAALHLYGETPWQLSPACAPFRTEAAPAAHEIHLRLSDTMPTPPDGTPCSLRTYRWRTGAQRHTLHDHVSDFTYAVTDGNSTELTVSTGYAGNLRTQLLLEAVDLFDILAERGMLVLHSSYVLRKEGDAILFSGASGIGKSTQAELWREFASARVINGDRALIDVDRGIAHGIFYSGTSGICENHSAPIRAIVLPEQRAENRVFVPAHREAFMRLLNQCSYYPWDAESAALMTELVARLVGRVPIYRLGCRKDEGAVRALENELRRE